MGSVAESDLGTSHLELDGVWVNALLLFPTFIVCGVCAWARLYSYVRQSTTDVEKKM